MADQTQQIGSVNNTLGTHPNVLIVDPFIVKSRNANYSANGIHNWAISLKSIIMDDQKMKAYSESWRLLEKMKLVVYSQRNPHDVLSELYKFIKQIRNYDLQCATVIQKYFQNSKEFDSFLSFIYSNLNPEGLRKLKANIDIILQQSAKKGHERLGELIHKRLLLLWKIFNEINVLENQETVAEQKRLLFRWITIISKGVNEGTWSGFKGPGGFFFRLDSIINLFESKYHNKLFADILRKNRELYGESQPEKWLGGELHSEQFPNSLWGMYNSLDSINHARINKLWKNAAVIGQNMKNLIENMMSNNPASALAMVKKRLSVLESGLKKKLSKIRGQFKIKFIQLMRDLEFFWKIINKIEDHDKSEKSCKVIASAIENNLKISEFCKRIISNVPDDRHPSTQHLTRLALGAKLFGDNKLIQNKEWRTLNYPSRIENELLQEFQNALTDVKNSYQELMKYIKSLNLVNSSINTKTSISGEAHA